MKRIFSNFSLVVMILAGFFRIARGDVLDSWTTNQITTNSFGLSHVVYGSGRYVAVGEQSDSGGIYSSEDGLLWTFRAMDPSAWGLTLSYAYGRFTGVSSGGVAASSTNGINWTFSDPLSSIFAYNRYFPGDITYGNGLFVVVGDTNGVGNIVTSPDGINWTPRATDVPPGGHIASAVYGAGKFVAVGIDGYEYTSATDTGVWVLSIIPGGSQISYCNGLFIVPLNAQTNLLSIDGINWSAKCTGITYSFGKVTYGNGLFISAKTGVLVTSSDGTNWIQYPNPLPGDGLKDASLATDGFRLTSIAGVYTNGGLPNAYNGFVYASDVLVGVRQTNGPAQIALSGLVGRDYQIQSADVLTVGSGNWSTNVMLRLTNTLYVWTDPAATNASRFYRGVLLP
jgi:hypothetical protein